jgi:hypothetical protein
MVPFLIPTNFKFRLFFKSFVIYFSHKHINFNCLDVIKLALSPNVILGSITHVFVINASQKRKESVCEEIVITLLEIL